MRTVRGPMITGAFIVAMVCALIGQTSKPPISTPSVVAPPTWWRAVPMADGRVFVTDGGISIDAAVVKPATLPETFPAAAGANVARLLGTPYDKETGLGDLRPGARPNTFVTAEGVVLNGNYVMRADILAIDDTGLPKQGTRSVGVHSKTTSVSITSKGVPIRGLC